MSATRPPRSSAAPIAVAEVASMTSRSPPDRADRFDRQAVLAGQQDERGGVRRASGHDQPGRALAEQPDRRRPDVRQPDGGAQVAPDRAFRQRDRETTGRHVLGRGDQAAGDRLANECLDRRLAHQVEIRRRVVGRHAGELRVGGADEARRGVADQHDRVAVLVRTPGRPASTTSSSRPTTPISGVGAIRPDGRLVVERDVAAGDRQTERPARIGEPANALAELPERVGTRRVAVVEAIGHAERVARR